MCRESATTTAARNTPAKAIASTRGLAITSRNGKATSSATRPPRRNPHRPGASAPLARTAALLPSTAKRLIELHKRCQHVALRLSQLLFGSQPLALRIEHLQITADAAHVSRVSEPALVPKRLSQD